ncbi:MAG: hypothetical protein K8I60_22945, partial [Anaerolineae bacterium]|nr:hypothetical protein [Anaerolineae bacterium]
MPDRAFDSLYSQIITLQSPDPDRGLNYLSGWLGAIPHCEAHISRDAQQHWLNLRNTGLMSQYIGVCPG